jgi:hypothetical protein
MQKITKITIKNIHTIDIKLILSEESIELSVLQQILLAKTIEIKDISL